MYRCGGDIHQFSRYNQHIITYHLIISCPTHPIQPLPTIQEESITHNKTHEGLPQPYLLAPKHIPHKSLTSPTHPWIPLMIFSTFKYRHTNTSTRS